MRFVHAVRDAGLRTAVVSSSAHCREVLEAAGIEDLFDARVDGTVDRARTSRRQARAGHLPRRRAPARRGGREHAAVFEDALAGVEAGRAGRFGYVVGVDRAGQAEALREHGADVVVRDLAELLAPRVIDHHAYPVEPWAVRERRSTSTCWPRASRSSRSRTGISGSAAISTRASRAALSGTYLGGFYESHPLSYGEHGFGFPEDGQTVVNVTDGKLIRLLVEDEPLDVHRGTLRKPRARARPAHRHPGAHGPVDLRRPGEPCG